MLSTFKINKLAQLQKPESTHLQNMADVSDFDILTFLVSQSIP